MDNKINNNLEKISTNLQDYEIEVPDKKVGLFNLFNKLKLNKNQKLLDSKNYIKTTSKSISYLWSLGNIRASLFNSLDSVREILFENFSSQPQKNSLAIEIVGENSQKTKHVSKISTSQKQDISPIIPITKN